MSSCDGCHADTGPQPGSPAYLRYRKVLWAAFAINLAMFLVELIAAVHSDSLSLLADSIDFLGDSANYLLSLAVLGAGLLWRARAAMVKGMFMLAFGVYITVKAILNLQAGVVPEAITMGAIGSLALIANLSVAVLLFSFRDGDSNMRSVWLCTRNDAIGNIAVMAAALAVFGTGSGLPDLIVAGIMAALAITASYSVIKQARGELKIVRSEDTVTTTGAPHSH